MRVGFPYGNDNKQDENKIYLLGNLDDKYYSLSIQEIEFEMQIFKIRQ